jgi:DNA-binding MarR family transcriptional regulator
MQRRLTNPGAHHGELISLRLLSQNDGMRQRDLAETLHLSPPRITSILQGLERSGAVSREPDADDQRVTRVFLTPEGRKRELEHRAAFEEYISQTIGALSQADRVELTRLLDEVSGNIAALLCPGAQDGKGRSS